jgi:hypothetical protein
MPISFDERLDLLQRVARGWLELKRAADGLSEVKLATPGTIGPWSARDMLVHVAIWDEELTRVLLDLDSGDEESWPPADGPARAAWNEDRVAELRSLPLDDALDYFEQAHFELMELLETSPSVTQALVEPVVRHYAAHVADLRALTRRR